jgi:hypothetical protein
MLQLTGTMLLRHAGTQSIRPLHAGLEGAHKLADRLREEGRGAEVRIPKRGKDPNDVLRQRRAC